MDFPSWEFINYSHAKSEWELSNYIYRYERSGYDIIPINNNLFIV